MDDVDVNSVVGIEIEHWEEEEVTKTCDTKATAPLPKKNITDIMKEDFINASTAVMTQSMWLAHLHYVWRSYLGEMVNLLYLILLHMFTKTMFFNVSLL